MVHIREAVREDDARLLALEAESPQGSGTSILLERSTYFYRSALADRGKVLVAEEGDRLVGVMAYVLREVWIEGEVVPVAYSYDLRADASYRRSMKRGLFLLWKCLEASIHAEGARLIYGHVKHDNEAMLSIHLRTGSQPIGDFDVITVPTRRGRTDLESVEDPISVAEEHAQVLGKCNMMPVALSDLYRRGAAAGYLRGVFRRTEGPSQARVSVWDISDVHRSRVMRLPLPLRGLGAITAPLARVLPVPCVPRPGDSVAFWHLFDFHTQGPAGTRLLAQGIAGVSKLAAAQGVHVLSLIRPHGIGPKFPHMLLKNTLTYRTMARSIAGVLPKPPLYVDVRDL